MTPKELGNMPADRWETVIPEGTALTSTGLTKRELFAAFAMNSLLDFNIETKWYGFLAERAVMAADALLSELVKTE